MTDILDCDRQAHAERAQRALPLAQAPYARERPLASMAVAIAAMTPSRPPRAVELLLLIAMSLVSRRCFLASSWCGDAH
jgi:hypothetical protein